MAYILYQLSAVPWFTYFLTTIQGCKFDILMYTLLSASMGRLGNTYLCLIICREERHTYIYIYGSPPYNAFPT